MSTGKSIFQSHPVHETLNDLITLLHENTDTSNKKSSSNLAKLYKILVKTRVVVQSIDPDFYPSKELDKIQNLLQSDRLILQLNNALNKNKQSVNKAVKCL